MGEEGFLKLSEVCERYKISSGTWARWRQLKSAPEGVQFGPRIRRWRLAELQDWEELLRGRNNLALGEHIVNSVSGIHFPKLMKRTAAGKAEKSEFNIADAENPAAGMVPASQVTNFIDRVNLLDFAQSLVVNHRIGKCLRSRISRLVKPVIRARCQSPTWIIWIEGLRRCNADYCPVCAESRGEKLERRIQATLDNLHGNNVKLKLLTFTARHSSEDALEKLVITMRDAWKSFWAASNIRQLAKSLGLVKQTWVMEICLGNSGWNVHYHCILQSKNELTDLNIMVLSNSWSMLLSKVGRAGALPDHSLVATVVRDNVAKYLTKQWRTLSAESGVRTAMQLGYDALTEKNKFAETAYKEYLVAMQNQKFHQFFVRKNKNLLQKEVVSNRQATTGQLTFDIKVSDLRKVRDGQSIAPIFAKYLKAY